MDTFGLKIIASDKVFYEGRCRKLIIPAPDGEKGILPNHENMVIAIAVGTAKVQLAGEDEWKDLAVGTGFAEIVNNRVTLLVGRPPRTGTAGACRRADAAETEHAGILPHPGLPRQGNDPIKSSPG